MINMNQIWLSMDNPAGEFRPEMEQACCVKINFLEFSTASVETEEQ